MELQSNGIKSVSFDELNNQLRDEYGGEEPPMLITPELVSSMYERDEDLQYYIRSMTPDKVEISEPKPYVSRGRTPAHILGLNSPEYAAAQKANGGFAGGAWAHLKKNESSVKKVSESTTGDEFFRVISYLNNKKVSSLTYDQLNKYFQNLGQSVITPELMNQAFAEDPRLQSLIKDINPTGIELGKAAADDLNPADSNQQAKSKSRVKQMAKHASDII